MKPETTTQLLYNYQNIPPDSNTSKIEWVMTRYKQVLKLFILVVARTFSMEPVLIRKLLYRCTESWINLIWTYKCTEYLSLHSIKWLWTVDMFMITILFKNMSYFCCTFLCLMAGKIWIFRLQVFYHCQKDEYIIWTQISDIAVIAYIN